MTSRRLAAAAAALVATGLLLVGCGGADEGGAPTAAAGSVPPSAALAPADATAFVTLSTDTASEAWSNAGRLVDLVPGAREAVDDVAAEMLSDGVSWDDDVRPMLGDELVVVVTKANEPVLLLQPKDAAKLEQLVAGQDEPAVIGAVGAWTAVAESDAALRAYRASLATGTLEDVPTFRSALEALPGAAIARAYMSGANVVDAVQEQLAAATDGKDELGLEALSMAVTPEEDGLHLTATVRTPEGGDGTSYEPKLLRRVPADAVAALSFGGTEPLVDRARDSLGLDEASEAVEAATGLSLDRLLGLFSGEGMLYLRAGATIPEVTLVLAPPDVEAAFEDVDTIVRSLAEGMGVEVREGEQDGVTVFRADTGDVNLSYARVDDAVVVTTGASGIRLFREDGDKLADAEHFRRAAERVGLGDRTSGFLYVDVDGLVPLVEGIADTADATLPDGARKAMEAFDGVILTGEAGDGGATTLTGFLAMNDG